ncbi:putative nuclease HARBI1 [Diretmus argenteus]
MSEPCAHSSTGRLHCPPVFGDHLTTFLYAVGDAEDLSKTTVCRTIRKVVLALVKLLEGFITFPGHMPVQSVKEGFYAIAGFPRVLGAIDCTHTPITALGENEVDFVNLKSYHCSDHQPGCGLDQSMTPGSLWSLHCATDLNKRALPVPYQPADVADPIDVDFPTGRAVRKAITHARKIIKKFN